MRVSSYLAAVPEAGRPVGLADRRRRVGAAVGGVIAAAVVLAMISSGEGRLFWAVPVVALLGGAVLVARGELAR